MPVTRAGVKRMRAENGNCVIVSSDCEGDCRQKISLLERENSELVNKCESYEEKLTRVERELENVKSKLTLEQQNKEVNRSPGSSGGGTDESPLLQRRDHPLLNDVILSTLFEHVRKHDLKSCRSVCKKWNEAANPFIRSKFEIQIYGDESTERGADTRRIGDFVNLFSLNTLGIPFAQYELTGVCNTNGVLTQFLKICGPTAKNIRLYADWAERRAFPIEYVSEILRSSPQLEYFEILEYGRGGLLSDSDSSKPNSYCVKLFPPGLESPKSMLPNLKKIGFFEVLRNRLTENCSTFFDELFTAAPNICDVEIRDVRRDSDGQDGIIRAVLNVIEKLGIGSIASLHLSPCSTKHLEVLQKLTQKPNGLKLKRLVLTTDGTSEDILNGIVLSNSFKHTLEEFHLEDTAYHYHCFKDFPKMPKLKSLTFRLSPEYTPFSVNLNNIFPALETLGLEFMVDGVYDDNFFTQFESSSTPCVTSLSLTNFRITSLGLERFLAVFPKLVKLELNLNFPVNGAEVLILRMIWTQMTQLEHLDIRSSARIDSVLTGIPTRFVPEVNIESMHLEGMTVKDRVETIQKIKSEYCVLPSIANLTNLKWLRLDDWQMGLIEGWGVLTDFTGYLALYSMNHLNHLEVNHCGLTRACCEILRTDMELDSWNFIDSNYKNIIPSRI